MTTTTPTNKKPHGEPLKPGEPVLDRDQLAAYPNYPSTKFGVGLGIVIGHAGVTAEEFNVDIIDRTVAEDNPDYPASDPVVRVLWHGDLDEVAGLWREWEIEMLQKLGEARSDLRIYHFPESRLIRPEEAAEVPEYRNAINVLGGEPA